VNEERLREKLGPARRNWTEEARQRWRLEAAVAALLAGADSAEALVRGVKHCRIALRGPRPLAEAISSAGGVRWSELTDDLMLRRMPGVFVAGEMIDWEAPTGGYLMQGAFAAGTRAGQAAIQWLNRQR
jgi:predicted flavoprotein YhiN